MIKNYKQYFGFIYFLLIQFVVFLFCLVNCLFQKIDISNGIIFFVFQLFSLYVPGSVINHYLIENNNIYKNIVFSYIFGITLSLIEYLLLNLINISFVSIYINILISCLSLYLYINKRLYIETENFDCNCIYLIVFLIITYVICFLSLALKNTLPTISIDTYYDKDFLYWVGNNISFTKGLPVQDYRLVGNNFYYHYFSSTLMAQISLATKLDVVTLSLFFSSVLPCLLLVFSSYVFLSELVNNKYLIIIGMIMILLCDGIYGFVTAHIYFCPFGYDYAYAIGMLSIAYLIQIYKNDKYSIKEIAVSCLLIMLATGFKGPIGIVTLMGYAIVSFKLLIEKKYKKGFICGISWLFVFLFTFFAFIYNWSLTGDSPLGLSYVGLFGGFDNNVGPMNEYVQLKNPLNINSSFILKGISIVLFIIKQNYFAYIMIAIVSIYCFVYLIVYGKINIYYLVLLSICYFGILLNLVTHQDGNSQLYFLSSTTPFAILLGLYFIDNTIKIKYQALIYIALLLVAILNIHDFYIYELLPKVNEGIDTYSGIRKDTFNTYGNKINGHFNMDDYYLCQWLKENTNENDYIAVDCFEYDNEKRYEIIGVFSQRFIWNDGKYSDYIDEVDRRNEIFTDMNISMDDIDFLKNENVKYLIKTPSNLIDYEDISSLTKEVYKDNKYIVYKLY